MSHAIFELEKKIKQTLYQMNIALNKSIMLLKEINHLTSENGEFNSTMDTVNEQFQILMSMFPKPDDNQTPEDEVVNDDTSVIIEEVQEVNSDTSA